MTKICENSTNDARPCWKGCFSRKYAITGADEIRLVPYF